MLIQVSNDKSLFCWSFFFIEKYPQMFNTLTGFNTTYMIKLELWQTPSSEHSKQGM